MNEKKPRWKISVNPVRGNAVDVVFQMHMPVADRLVTSELRGSMAIDAAIEMTAQSA